MYRKRETQNGSRNTRNWRNTSCNIITKKRKPKPKPKTEIEIQEIEEIPPVILLPKKIKPKPSTTLEPEPIKSFKELRSEHMKDRMKTRNVKIEKLFEQAF